MFGGVLGVLGARRVSKITSTMQVLIREEHYYCFLDDDHNYYEVIDFSSWDGGIHVIPLFLGPDHESELPVPAF